MILVSLFVNIVVLVPVLVLMMRDAPAMQRGFGPDTAARRILGSMYGAILIASVALAGLIGAGHPQAVAWAQAVLVMQIVYKAISIRAVGLRNPVIASNAAIAALHLATLWQSWPVD